MGEEEPRRSIDIKLFTELILTSLFPHMGFFRHCQLLVYYYYG